MVESIQNRFYHRLNQLQIESTIGRINQWLNPPMVESTYGCRESQKSKKVKNPADCQTFALYQAKAPIRQAPGPIRQVPHRGLIKAPGSWELGDKLGAGSWNKHARRAGSWCELDSLAVKYGLNKTYVHFY